MTTKNVPPKAIECRFVSYNKSNEPGDHSDMHFIKEQVHTSDGAVVPNTRMVIDYQRPFYVTKKGLQNHQDRKEWEDVMNLNKFMTTQTNLTYAVAKALGKPWHRGTLRDLEGSQYVYGADILSTCLIKQSYADKWSTFTPYSYAAFDTETCMFSPEGDILMATISFKKKVFTAVQKRFVQNYVDVENQVKLLAEKYIGETLKARNITLEIMVVDTEIDVIKQTINKAHEWKPDFLSVWNIAFDMDKIIAACKRAGIEPEDILSDPSVPQKYRSFNFKKGAAKKTTASGRVMNFKPSQRWHTVFCPASFYWVDAMCVYRQVRTGAPEEPSYALDDLLKKNLKNVTKLKFEKANHVTKADWHKFMQTNYPLEYIVYNQFDCISMEILDEKTLDICMSFPMQAGASDFQNFNSQPRRSANDLHFFCLKHEKVVGSTAQEMTDDFDTETVDLKDWIVMLPSHLVADNGLKIIEENPELSTNARAHIGDLDVAGSYPNGECALNVSKETTSKEIIELEGVDEHTRRMGTINLSAGFVNATEIAVTLFGLPSLDQWLEAFNEESSLL